MPGRRPGRSDGSRRRCLTCGHPEVEHRQPEGCWVPSCLCDTYTAPLEEHKGD